MPGEKVIRQPIITVLGHVDSGKCVGGDHYVDLERYVTVEDLYYGGGYVESLDVSIPGFVRNRVGRVVREEVDKWVYVSLDSDSYVESSFEHRFLVRLGPGLYSYTPAHRLRPGDEVVGRLGDPGPDGLSTVRVRRVVRHYTPRILYDLESPGYRNFVVNGVVAHNTSLLDKIRGTAVQLREAGGITQHIGASMFPPETLREICGPLLEKFGFEIIVPGILVIDTPGHEVFSNLRRRGGSASDIAILVVDITKGFQPQTHESLQILMQRRVPFLVAANKVDLIHGWRPSGTLSIIEALKRQSSETLIHLEERIGYIISALNTYRFDADRFDRVRDFRRTVAIVPVSAKTGEGIQELLTILIGLVQKFLINRLEVDINKPGSGTILEVSSEHGLGKVVKAIHIDGTVRVGDTFIAVGRNGVVERRIRSILMPAPLDELRDPRKRFRQVETSYPAAGIIIVAPDLDEVYAGSPFYSVRPGMDASIPDLARELEEEVASIKIDTDKVGVVAKADTLGTLEAMIAQMNRKGIPIRKADVGDGSKKEVIEAGIVKEKDVIRGAVLAFNVDVLPDAEELARSKKIPIFRGEILYRLIDDYLAWVEDYIRRKRERLFQSLVKPGKIQVLEGYVFRRSKPAIVGVRVEAGEIRPRYRLVRGDGEVVGTIHQIQDRGKAIDRATRGMEVAISIREAEVGDDFEEGDYLYVYVPEEDARTLMKEFLADLPSDYREALEEFLEIIRSRNPLFARG